MHKERERDHTQITPWTQSPEPFDFAPFNFTVQLRLRIAPRSHPSTSPMNPEPKIARLRLRQLSTLLLRRSTLPVNPEPRIACLRLHRLHRLHTLWLRRLRTPSTSPRSHPNITPIALRSQLRNGWRKDNFCFKGQGLDHVGTLGKFCCPTLERSPPPFYLIRHEPMELE